MKTVYSLIHISTDFETHCDCDLLGIYETEELAKKAAREYSGIRTVDEDNELVIEEVLLNHFVWEK